MVSLLTIFPGCPAMPGKPGFPFVPGSPYHRKHTVIQDKLHDLIQRL